MWRYILNNIYYYYYYNKDYSLRHCIYYLAQILASDPPGLMNTVVIDHVIDHVTNNKLHHQIHCRTLHPGDK